MIQDYPKAVHRLAVARLEDLSIGAPPDSQFCGICNDLNMNFRREGVQRSSEYGYSYCMDVFRSMGLDANSPIDYSPKHLWEGEAGVERRALAGAMAAHIKGKCL